MRLWLAAIYISIAPLLPGHSAPLLSIDFNHRTNDPVAATQPGFTSFVITSNTSPTTTQTNATIRMIGTNRVILSGGPTRAYGDRSHQLPTNQAAFTETLLLRDAVYSPATTPEGGLDLVIEGLTPSARVQVTLWSFDALSPPIRASDWRANGVLVRSGYQFTNSMPPTHNEQYRFSFPAIVDAAGRLEIQGRHNPISLNNNLPQPGVFLNAIRVDPEPLQILSAQSTGNEFRITFTVRPEPSDYVIEETTGTQWRFTTGVNFSAPTNNRVIARFPKPTQPKLYRVRYSY